MRGQAQNPLCQPAQPRRKLADRPTCRWHCAPRPAARSARQTSKSLPCRSAVLAPLKSVDQRRLSASWRRARWRLRISRTRPTVVISASALPMASGSIEPLLSDKPAPPMTAQSPRAWTRMALLCRSVIGSGRGAASSGRLGRSGNRSPVCAAHPAPRALTAGRKPCCCVRKALCGARR